jgi:hypothetical protein
LTSPPIERNLKEILLGRVFSGELLAGLYRQLPGVKEGNPGYRVGTASALAARKAGGRFEYFVRTSAAPCGDTCSGPIDDPAARRFASTSIGAVTEL